MGGCKPKMAGCAATCGHRAIVMGFREEYQRQNDELWERSGGYRTEYQDNLRQLRENGTPQITFKDWLKGMKRDDVNRDRPKMTDEQEAIQQMAGIDWATNPVRSDVKDGRAFLRFNSIQDANEGMLLATALSSKGGLEALRVIGPREFDNPFHQDVAKSITWLADRNRPHDGAAVTTFMREHNRLPLEMDPQVPLVEVDPDEWGLGAWERYSPPADTAPGFAQAVRSEYRAREMEAICARGANGSRAAIEYGDDGMVQNDMVGQVRRTMADELRVLPPALDGNLQPVSRGDSMQAIDTTAIPGLSQAKVIDMSLRLPPPPALSVAGREALSRG